MNKQCPGCGAPFRAPPPGARFCSRPCAYANRPKSWPAHRPRVLPRRDPMDRFRQKVVVAATGCHIWTGATIRGYGEMSLPGVSPVYTHRWIWEQTVGPIPDGLQIDHLCRTPLCQNVAHMEIVTPTENVRRGMSLSQRRRLQTECHRGHPFDGENTRVVIDSRGRRHRRCRTCDRATERRRAQSRRGANRSRGAAA